MRTTLTRALLAAAAILCFAASSAAARPIDPVGTAPERQQDLRHLAAGNSIAASDQHVGSVYAAPAPASASHPVAHDSGPSDDGSSWMLIALGIAGVCVVGAGAIVLTTPLRAYPRAT